MLPTENPLTTQWLTGGQAVAGTPFSDGKKQKKRPSRRKDAFEPTVKKAEALFYVGNPLATLNSFIIWNFFFLLVLNITKALNMVNKNKYKGKGYV